MVVGQGIAFGPGGSNRAKLEMAGLPGIAAAARELNAPGLQEFPQAAELKLLIAALIPAGSRPW